MESLELSEKQNNTSGGRLSNLLDQLNEDLDIYERLFHKLRHLGKTAETGTQNTLFKHYAMTKYDFYMDSRHTYRRLRKTTEPEQNNRISNVTKTNVMTDISRITKSTETNEQRLKEVEKDSITDRVVEAAAGSSTNATKVQTETEERKTEHVKRSSSFFDRNLRPGSFKKGKSKKKQLKLDPENNLLIDVEENKPENGGNPSSKEQLKQTINFAKEIIENSNVQQSSLQSFIDKDAIDKDGSSKQTLEQTEPPKTDKRSLRNTGNGKLGFTDEDTAGIEKQPDISEENNTVSVKRNNSFFDRKLRPGSFLKRQANKKPFKPDSEPKVEEDDSAATDGIQCSKKPTNQARVSTADTIGEQRPDQISFKTFVCKEPIVQYNKAPEEVEKAVSAQSTGGISLSKSDKIVLPTDKNPIDAEVKGDNIDENSSAFDRKARKGSFFKRKTKKNELKADPVTKLEKDEEKTVNVEACSYQSTVSEQTTKDRSSGQSPYKDLSKPLEVNGCTSKKSE